MAVESEPSGWTGWRVYTANTAKRNGKQRVQEVTLFWMVFSFISVLHFHSHFIDMMVFHFPLYPFRLGIRWQNGNCNNNNRMKGRTNRGGEKRWKKNNLKINHNLCKITSILYTFVKRILYCVEEQKDERIRFLQDENKKVKKSKITIKFSHMYIPTFTFCSPFPPYNSSQHICSYVWWIQSATPNSAHPPHQRVLTILRMWIDRNLKWCSLSHSTIEISPTYVLPKTRTKPPLTCPRVCTHP